MCPTEITLKVVNTLASLGVTVKYENVYSGLD